jgi:thioredoxin reductase
MTRTEIVDVAIVGAGAAGLSAGLVLTRAQARVAIIDGGAPRNAPAAEMHGFISRDGVAPQDFLRISCQEVVGYGGSLVSDSVREVFRRADGAFDLRLGNGMTVAARAVLIATGLTDQLPSVPGLQDRWGILVHHCPYCHGYEVRDQNIAVIAGGAKDVSMRQAGLLRRYTDRVSLLTNDLELTRAERQRLEAFGIVIVDGAVSHLLGAPGTLDGVEMTDGTTVTCEAAFVAPRPQPNDRLLRALGCEVDATSGLVIADAFGQTSVAGVWAAGNVVTPVAQVITAAGAGSASAMAINGWLLQLDLDAATATRR